MQSFKDTAFLFIIAFISAWQTYGYLVLIGSSAFLAQGNSSSEIPRGNPL